MRRPLTRAVGYVAAVILATAAPASAQETPPPAGYGQSQPAPPVGPSAPAAPAGYAQSAAYLQYLQYMALMGYAAGAASAAPPPASSGGTPPPAVPEWFTNGAQMTSVPTSGPGSAYFTNGAEATIYPPAQPSGAPVTPAQPVASAASAQPPPQPAPSASAEPAPAPTLTARGASTAPQSGIPWIQATPVPENVDTYLAPSEIAPPVAIERAIVPATSATSEAEGEPRATLLIPSEREGAPFRSGGTLALILAALVTGMLVGGMAVVRFRSRGAAPPPG